VVAFADLSSRYAADDCPWGDCARDYGFGGDHGTFSEFASGENGCSSGDPTSRANRDRSQSPSKGWRIDVMFGGE
jgi:hypothetical protein